MGQPSRPRRRSDKRRPVRRRWIRRQLGRCWFFSAALLAGMTAGTLWLSDQTAQGPSMAQLREAIGGRPPMAAAPRIRTPAAHAAPAHSARDGHTLSRLRRIAGGAWPPPRQLPARLEDGTAAAPVMPTRYLTPRLIPPETMRYALMRVHHYGRVVLGVRLDPAGGVAAVWLQQPSGDAVLDRYALQRVRDWRFAPPPPDQATGWLALRFEPARR